MGRRRVVRDERINGMVCVFSRGLIVVWVYVEKNGCMLVLGGNVNVVKNDVGEEVVRDRRLGGFNEMREVVGVLS